MVKVTLLNSSIVNPREVLVSAIKESTSSVVLIHNYPSGNPTPSNADVEIIGVNLRDHIIIGDQGFYSFAN